MFGSFLVGEVQKEERRYQGTYFIRCGNTDSDLLSYNNCIDSRFQSNELYNRMAQYDIVFLYLANRSDDESWKNVIRKYNVTGENVVHYNLPEEQQSAVESFLKVNQYPTYRLIDSNSNRP